jgi:cation-transporting P-type ATPase 13A2
MSHFGFGSMHRQLPRPCRTNQKENLQAKTNPECISNGRSSNIRHVEAYSKDLIRSAVLAIPSLFLSSNIRLQTLCGFRQIRCGSSGASRYLAYVKRTESKGEWVLSTYQPIPKHDQLDLGAANVLPLKVCDAAKDARFRGILTVEYKHFLLLVVDEGLNLTQVGASAYIYELPPELPPLSKAANTLEEGDNWGRPARRALYGRNRIEVPVLSRWALFGSELVHPFFLFQLLVIAIWVADFYYAYSIAIIITSAAGAWLHAHEVHMNSRRLAQLASGISTEIAPDMASHLVPGDKIEIKANEYVPADCTILAGVALVDESSLTGECAPVRKYAWKSDTSDCFWSDAEVSLYSGTLVLSSRPGTRAIVTRTACSTVRGRVVRDIILQENAPKGWMASSDGRKDNNSFQRYGFAHEIYIVVLFLSVMGILGAIWSARLFSFKFRLSTKDVILKSLDLITIAVPPALPATVTFGLAFAIARLKNKSIICVQASAIPRAGRTQIVCFDKTGTLTESSLKLQSVYSNVPRSVVPLHADRIAPATLCCILDDRSNAIDFRIPPPLDLALACCHSLSVVGGNLVGDEVDMRLFRMSNFSYIDHDSGVDERSEISAQGCCQEGEIPRYESNALFKVSNGHQTVTILRIFEFRSDLARQGTIALLKSSSAESKLLCFFKGAPDIIATLCDAESVPENLHALLREHTLRGHRAIAIATRVLPFQPGLDPCAVAESVTRSDAECGMTFLGLAILENPLKCDTSALLAERYGNLDFRLVTGDHALTAMSVAKQCGIIPHGSSAITLQARLITSEQIPGNDIEQKHSSNNNRRIVFDSMELKDAPPNGIRSYLPEDVLQIDKASFRSVATNDAPSVCLVVTGAVIDSIPPHGELCDLILRRGKVFARMSPVQKTGLIKMLREQLGQKVLMCGDGANDIGALREADTGVAISSRSFENADLLASNELDDIVILSGEGVVVPKRKFESPLHRTKQRDSNSDHDAACLSATFTSRRPSIAAVFEVIRQGRASAAASLAAFQYMFMYSIIQFSSVLVQYSVGGLVSDGQYLYVDLFVVLPLGVLMGRLDASGAMSRNPPPASIWDGAVMVSTLLMAAVQVLFQLAIFYWVLPTIPPSITMTSLSNRQSLVTRVPLVTGMFVFVNMQFIWTAIALNLGWPHRRPIYTSASALFGTVLITITSLLLLGLPTTWVANWLEMVDLGRDMRLKLIALSFLNFVCTLGVPLAIAHQNA